jgi:hypothetical protein
MRVAFAVVRLGIFAAKALLDPTDLQITRAHDARDQRRTRFGGILFAQDDPAARDRRQQSSAVRLRSAIEPVVKPFKAESAFRANFLDRYAVGIHQPRTQSCLRNLGHGEFFRRVFRKRQKPARANAYAVRVTGT